MKFYIVTFDRVVGKSYKELHDGFVSNPRIKLWWHYIKSSYIIGTEMTAGELSEVFKDSAQKANISTTHLVVKIDMRTRQGMLVRDAWDWFKANVEKQDPLV
ncbi:hypothetical protein ACEOPL_10990 [Pseudomonas aeruginosa]|nr:hypothetical protein [Pseudomonas aeruginosa]